MDVFMDIYAHFRWFAKVFHDYCFQESPPKIFRCEIEIFFVNISHLCFDDAF